MFPTIARAPSRSRAMHLRPLWRGFALIVVFNGLLALWLMLRPAPPPMIQAVDNLAQAVGPLLALPLCWKGLGWPGRYRQAGRGASSTPSRWMPVFLGLGVLGYAVGQIIWTYYEEVLDQPPFPSWADAGYLAAYPFLFAGLLLLPRHALPSAVRLRVLLDGVMMMAGVVVFSWYFVLGPAMLQGDESGFDKLVGAAYPFCDLVLFFCLIFLWSYSKGLMQRLVVVLFSLGLGCILVVDSIFAYGNMHQTYVTGGIIDVGWPLGYMLIALAARAACPASGTAASPREELSVPLFVPSLWSTLLPYAFLPAVGVLLLSTGRLRSATPLEQGVWVGAGVLGAVVVLRQVVALLETRQLYGQVEERNQALAAANAKLKTLASTDSVTGLLNHRAFQSQLDQEISRANRSGRSVALMMVDLDDFRVVNNTHGHQAGDRMLIALAEALKMSLRVGDSAGRYGGDEFAALLPEADLEEALIVAERVRAAIAAIALPMGETFIHMTTSLGVAVLPRHARARDGLIEAADQAAYAAKDAGKNCVRVYDATAHLTPVGPV